MLSIKEITNDDEFYNLKDEWNKLLLNSESNNLFLTWEWLYNWWKFFGYNKELKILAIKDDNELKGIAPFYISKNKGKNTYQINFLGSTGVGSDYLDFILQKGYENKVIFAIYRYLNSNDCRWQSINFTDIPANSRSIELIRNYYKNNFYMLTKNHTICPYIPLPDNYELFMKSLSSNMRYNLGRKRRRFENGFKGKFIVVSEMNELDKSIEELFRLNLSRMKVKKIYSPFNNEQFSQFHKKIIPAFFEKDWLRLCFLKVGNEFIACLYIFKYGGKYYYYQSGFDPEWERLSPGLLLFSYCIENATLEGMNEFDFLQGEEEYKYHWTKNIRTNMQIKIYRRKSVYLNEKFKTIAKQKLKQSLKQITNLFLI